MIASSIPITDGHDAAGAPVARPLQAPRAMFVELMLWTLLAGLVRLGAQCVWLVLRSAQAAANPQQQWVQAAGSGMLIFAAILARAIAERGRPSLAAKFFYAAGVPVGLLLGMGAPFALPLAVAVPTVAMVMALSYVSRRALLGMAAGIGGVAVGALLLDALLGERSAYIEQSALMRLTFVLLFVLVVVALLRAHRWQHEAGRSLVGVNDELSLIRDTLEEQVAARTSQLTQQVDIARGAQEASARERDFATAIITSMSQGIAILDDSLKLNYANPAFARMLGRTADALIGMSWLDLCQPDDRVLYGAWVRGTQDAAQGRRMMRLCKPDGAALYVDVSSLPAGQTGFAPARNAALDAARTRVIVVTDLTAQMQADAERRLLQSVVEHSDEPIMITDAPEDPAQMRMLYVNKAFERLSGYGGADLLGRNPGVFTASAAGAEMLADVHTALHSGRSMTVEMPFKRNDARMLWVEWNVTPVRDQTGAVAQWVAMLRDTTARRNAEERLKQQNAYLAALHDTALGIVNHLDLDELLQTLAERMVRLTGTPDGLLVLFDPDSGAATNSVGQGIWTAHIARRFTRGVGVVGCAWESAAPVVVDDYARWPHRDPDVPPGLFQSAAAAPVISNGVPVGALLVSHSNDMRRVSPDEVELLSRLAELASVAYDNARLFAQARANEHELERRVEQRTLELRQALNDIVRLRELAVQAAAQSERARLARELHDSVSQALYGIALGARTIQDSGAVKLAPQLAGPLDYIVSLTEAGLTEMRALIFELRPESLQEEGLHAALKKQSDAIRLRFRLKVTAQLCDEPDCEFAVKEALYRIALEAIHNAVKHARASEIVLVLSESDDGVMVEVRDNGQGFDPQGVYPGHLGLKSMRERALSLKGHVSIDSAPGQGASIRARFPNWPDQLTNPLGATIDMFGT